MGSDDKDKLMAKLEDMRKADSEFDLNHEEKALLKSAGDGGDLAAMYYLGRYYLDGDWEEEGWRHIETAAAGGLPAAKCSLGNREYWSSREPDSLDHPVPPIAMDLWRQAANAGDYVAQYMLAEYADLNDAERMRLLMESANARYCSAYDALGERYYRGIGVSRNFAAAAEYFEKAFQATAYPNSQATQLAVLYLEGQGVKRNITKAMEYMDASANYQITDTNDEPYIRGESFEQLARMYLLGDVASQNRDACIVKSLFWYQYSYELGYKRSALYVLCLLRQTGLTDAKDKDVDDVGYYESRYAHLLDDIRTSLDYDRDELIRDLKYIQSEVARAIADMPT